MRRAGALLALILIAFACFALPANAEGEEEGKRLWNDFRDSLPDLVRDRLPEQADDRKLTELVGMKSLLALFARSVGDGLGEVLPFLASLLGIVLLGAAAELLRPDRLSESVRRAMGAAISASAAVMIWQCAERGVDSLLSLLSGMRVVIAGAIPALTGVQLAAGQGGTAAAGGTALAAGIALTEVLASGVLPAIAGCSFGFALVGSLGGGLKLDGIAKTLRGLYTTLLGLVSFILTTSLALQKSLASAADGAAMRSAKYAVGSMIPLVGGTISAVLGTLGSSMTLLKNSIGVGAVAALLMLALPTLVYLLLARFSFSISAAAAHLLGAPSMERLLAEFRGVYDMLLAVGAISAVMFLISLSLMLGGTGVAV